MLYTTRRTVFLLSPFALGATALGRQTDESAALKQQLTHEFTLIIFLSRRLVFWFHWFRFCLLGGVHHFLPFSGLCRSVHHFLAFVFIVLFDIFPGAVALISRRTHTQVVLYYPNQYNDGRTGMPSDVRLSLWSCHSVLIL